MSFSAALYLASFYLPYLPVGRHVAVISPALKESRHLMKRLMSRIALIGAVALGLPALAQAQSAIIYGSLSNFDISNDTGQICHGFEIQLDGIQPAAYGGSFNFTSYGNLPRHKASDRPACVRNV